jgi:hypothetical protein
MNSLGKSVSEKWLIDWSIMAWRLSSNISSIFRTGTSSIIYKNYIEMGEGMDQLKNEYHW